MEYGYGIRSHLSDGEYSDTSNTLGGPYNDCQVQPSFEYEDGCSVSTSSPKRQKLSDDTRSDRARSGRHSRHESKKSHKPKRKKKHSKRRSDSSSESSRSRSNSRERSRSRRHRNRSHRRRSRSSGDQDDYSDNDRYRGRSRDRNSTQNQSPTNTIMVRGLPLSLTEKEINNDLIECDVTAKDVRLIRHRDTGKIFQISDGISIRLRLDPRNSSSPAYLGLSRGFCFLEFHDVSEAVKYMELKQGTVLYQDQYEASMIYSVGRASNAERDHNTMLNATGDWYCSKCASHNFKRRDSCYRCQALKSEDGVEQLREELSKSATTTLLFQNLDMLSTEDSVQQALQSRIDLRSIPSKSIKISREAPTNLSRGICFVETNNVSDAVRLYDALLHMPLVVDDRTVRVAYCKPPVQAVSLNSAAAAALAAAQWSTTGPAPSTSSTSAAPEDEIRQLAEYSATLYANTPEEKAKYLTYYMGYYRDQHSKGEKLIRMGKLDESNTAGTAFNSGESDIASGAGSAVRSVHQPNASSTSIAPDLTRLQYDSSTGYYYDPVTLLYYDSTTERYYDSIRQEYLTWDTNKGGYVPVTADGSVDQEGVLQGSSTEDKEKGGRPTKIKVCKSVLKDTLKQAMSFNAKKDSVKKDSTSGSLLNDEFNGQSSGISKKTSEGYFPPAEPSWIQPIPEVFMAERGSGSEEDETYQPKTSFLPRSASSIPESFMDLEKIACTLCKRQFGSVDILSKHTKLSELHKTNLANLTKSSVEPSFTTAKLAQNSYRDRAKERRNFFGPEDTGPNNRLKQRYMDALTAISTLDQPASTPAEIPEDNVGNRMLQKMGWKSGKGLGKNETGRTDIITTEMRTANAGLGLPASQFVPSSSDKDRYTRSRHLTLARYRELDEKF